MIKKTPYIISFIIIALVLFVFGPSVPSFIDLKLAPYTDSFYSIYLDNGEVLYGKVRSSGFSWIKLTNVYYFQTVEIDGKPTRNLVSQLANNLTTPKNYLLVSKSKILSIEKLGQNAKLLDIMK